MVVQTRNLCWIIISKGWFTWASFDTCVIWHLWQRPKGAVWKIRKFPISEPTHSLPQPHASKAHHVNEALAWRRFSENWWVLAHKNWSNSHQIKGIYFFDQMTSTYILITPKQWFSGTCLLSIPTYGLFMHQEESTFVEWRPPSAKLLLLTIFNTNL